MVDDVVSSPALARAERFTPKPGTQLHLYQREPRRRRLGSVEQISSTGLLLACEPTPLPERGQRLDSLSISDGTVDLVCGSARTVRSDVIVVSGAAQRALGLSFEREQAALIDALKDRLESPRYLNAELQADENRERPRTHASDRYIDRFYAQRSRDLFAKCDNFRNWVDDMQARGLYQRFFRVTVTGESGDRVFVFDPVQRRERPMLCFDSNSYLCLHRHPRVVERVQAVLRQVGYGTPSAQLLGGTNRYLRELEVELSTLHGREETIVFPTGFAANAGVISALIRHRDALLRDRFAHASIQEACRTSSARFNRVFAHNDVSALEKHLAQADQTGCDGKLVVTDAVFSMHGRIAPLPELVALARRYDARLMVDDAHGVGVIGDDGLGIEDHFGMPGSIDVLMGTLSKALGAIGGYVTGTRNLVNYLRFFAPSSMFTTSLPAALCAGVVEAIRVLREEPEHRALLWRNIRQVVPALSAAGFIVPEPASAIITILLGSDALTYAFNRELFDAGIKCSTVAYPAVPKGESILRLTLNARHTPRELAFAVDVLTHLGRRFDVLHRSADELRELGAKFTSSSDTPPPH